MMLTNQNTFSRLGEFLTGSMERNQAPGVAVGVLFEGQEATAGYGLTNVDHPLPVTDETCFQIGSITKTFTGTLIMRLVEMGNLDLDGTIQTYLPDFKVADEVASSQSTIGHLLTHTGGWAGDFFHDTGPGNDALSQYVADMADLEQLAPLGRLWSYNNAGFAVAGAIIEKVTGKPYEQALKELLLEPLGLENFYLDPADVMTYRFAVGHSEDDGEVKVARPWALPRSIYPVGGLICHTKALLRYARFLLGDGSAEDGTPLLRPESLALMQSRKVMIGQAHEAMGLTWFINHIDGVLTLSHGGGTKGQVSLLLLVPERNFALVILTNGALGGHVTDEARRWSLKNYLGLVENDPEPFKVAEEELAQFTGRYERPYMDVDLRPRDGYLMAHLTPKGSFPSKDVAVAEPPPPMTCAFYGPDYFIVLDGEYQNTLGEFIRLEDGSIRWLRFGTRVHKRINQ